MQSNHRKERILAYGKSGSGKSSIWIAIAQWTAEDNIKIHVGDTDNAWDAMGYEEIEKVVVPTHIYDYLSALQWARKIRENITSPDDWVVLDLANRAWPWAQEHFWNGKLGDDMLLGDVYLQNQLNIDSKGEEGESAGGAHGANWGVIYKYYHGLINTVLNLPCHVLFVGAAKELRTDSKPAVVAQYKSTGFYPAGPPNENELAHNFHSVLFCAETPMGWVYSTVKERGPIGKPARRMLKGEKVDDFVMTYLMKVAGWKL